MRKLFHWVWSFLEILIIVYVIGITSFVLCRNKYGYTQFGDYTFANIDLISENNIQGTKKGDLLVVKNSNDIHEGDLIYYYTVYNDSYIIKSNIVVEVTSDDYSSLYKIDDSDGLTISSSRVLGKYSNIYHSLGGILNIVESKIGFLFLVLLPIMVVFIYQLYEFIVIIRYEDVEEDEGDDKLDNSSNKKLKKEKASLKKKEEDIEIL